MDKIFVMIVDKQALFRVGVRHALSQQPDLEMYDSAPSQNSIALIEANPIDVLLLDIDYPSLRGLELARKIGLHCPTTKVIMLTSNPDDKQLFEIIKTGAVAYLDKSITAEELSKTIRQVFRGEYPINDSILARPKVAEHVLKQFQSIYSNGKTMEVIVAHLTSRETEILRYIADGNSNKQIAYILQISSLANELELDFAYQANGIGRFRINAYLQEGTISLACRPVQTQIPTIEELGLPEVCKSLVLKPSGLIIVTGPTGCGKSTTLAAMMNYLNQERKCKVVTIEDPIEFVYQDKKCVFSQRELGKDTRSFANALKHALRQDPNVILVGEMRDLETMSTVLTAAETGHLVITTLHTPSASHAIDRFIDIFPPHQQQQVRIQLSTTLEGVLYQTLVLRSDGSGRIAAVEVMLATLSIRNLIREGKTYQLMNAIQTGSQYGMQTLDQALLALCCNGVISQEEALARSANVEELNGMLDGSH